MLEEVGMFHASFRYRVAPRKQARVSGLFFLVVLLPTTFGCARTPPGAVGAPPRQLILTLTVAGVIAPEDFYYLAMDFSGDESKGPLPIVGPPWGNGWGTGSITHYVLIHGNQAEVYRFRPGTGRPLP